MVTVGARHPLAQPVQYSAKVHGSDGLGEIPIDREVRVRTDISAAERLVQLARQHPGELEIIATGPLTNIAPALMIEPELSNLIAGISVMGGAVTVPGNNTPWAESNIKHDPEAASLVFSAGWRRCVPAGLDVTLTTWLRSADLAAIDALTTPAGRLAQLSIGKFSAYFSVTYGRQSCPIHDPTAAILLLHPEVHPVPNDVGYGLSRSRIRNFALVPVSWRSMAEFRAAWVIQAAVGCAVAPRIRTRRVACSIAVSSHSAGTRTTAGRTRGGGAWRGRPMCGSEPHPSPRYPGGARENAAGRPPRWSRPRGPERPFRAAVPARGCGSLPSSCAGSAQACSRLRTPGPALSRSAGRPPRRGPRLCP
ncbi:hypothetical protein CGL27_08540 [Streptomyces sp. 11-1-2]|nr:hypothetical protein CGL27_08540 [Streptomyces sp. 11-1-2]